MQFIGNYLYIKYKQNTTLLKNYATCFCQIFDFKLEFALGNVRSIFIATDVRFIAVWGMSYTLSWNNQGCYHTKYYFSIPGLWHTFMSDPNACIHIGTCMKPFFWRTCLVLSWSLKIEQFNHVGALMSIISYII